MFTGFHNSCTVEKLVKRLLQKVAYPLQYFCSISTQLNCWHYRLSWLPGELPDYALTTEIYYIVERRCPPSKNWLEIATDVKDTSYTMKDYRPEKDYMFRIRASNEYGISDPSLSATVFSKQAGVLITWLSGQVFDSHLEHLQYSFFKLRNMITFLASTVFW